jgi:hypothetical protein
MPAPARDLNVARSDMSVTNQRRIFRSAGMCDKSLPIGPVFE